MNTRRIRASGVLAIALLLGAARPAEAQPPVDPAVKAAARAAAEEALGLFDKGNYSAALEKFNRAYDLVQAPTMSLMAGRCLVKLGRMVEGSERLLATSRMTVDPTASEAFQAAVSDAATEYKALLPQIPKLVISLAPTTPRDAEVTLDGARVPPALFGLDRPTDPGHHVLKAQRGAESAVKEVDLKEGQRLEVPLSLKKEGGTITPPPGGGSEAGSGQRGAGWGLVGVGAAGVIVGAVTWGIAVSEKNNLVNNDGCNSSPLICPSSVTNDVNRYNTLRIVWPTGMAIGGASLVTGVVLILTAPRGRPAAGSLPFQPWVGPRAAGVTGVF